MGHLDDDYNNKLTRILFGIPLWEGARAEEQHIGSQELINAHGHKGNVRVNKSVKGSP